MQKTPKGLRLHIGIFGRRNVGKSTLLNALVGQDVSIVSDMPGTTTDPVEKPMELLPIGPVLFIDTAGIDDIGALGKERIKRTEKIIERTDVAIIVTEYQQWDEFEEALADKFRARKIPFLVVFNKSDLAEGDIDSFCGTQCSYTFTSAIRNEGIDRVKHLLIELTPAEYFKSPTIVGDLIEPGELVVLVVPIDLEAPKGRLILPQVQTIRDVLDFDSYCMIVKERELRDALDRLNRPPGLVVTDSQAFLKVAGDVSDDVPMTSFSILFARQKGDLEEFVKGALTIDDLQSGDRVLIAETCSHHQIGEDIGRIKIPRWVRQYTGAQIEFEHVGGCDFPDDVSEYKLVIHCGSCMGNRREMLSRIYKCRKAGVPITNYGVTIAYSLGILERAIRPFPYIHHLVCSKCCS